MLTRFNVFSPIPKVKFKLNKNNTGEYYNSTRKAAFENVKTKDNKEILKQNLNDQEYKKHKDTIYHKITQKIKKLK